MARRQLVRSLTLIPATAVILANVIGTGVFVKARVVTCNVGSPGMALLVWGLAGLLSLTGAAVYAELATLMPRAGGEYNFIGAAYGRWWAFLYGWTRMLALGASAAAAGIIFTIFLNDLTGGRLSATAQRLLPVAAIASATLMNFASARANGAMATVLTVAKVAVVAGIGVGAFVLADGSWAHFGATAAGASCAGVPASARGGIPGFGAAMLGALWSYNGWSIVATLGGEVRDPGRTLPRALIGGTVVVVALYLLINTAYYYVLSPGDVASVAASSSVAREVVARVVGAGAAMVMSVALMTSTFGTLHTGLLFGPRLPYALARSGLLPRGLARVSRRGTPVVAVVLLAAWSIALTLSGTFDELTDMYIFLLWVFYGVVATTVFTLRRRLPDAPRPYRLWGYPIVPALFFLVAVYLVVNTLVATPGRGLAGLVLIASGVPVYAFFARRTAPVAPEAWLGDGGA